MSFRQFIQSFVGFISSLCFLKKNVFLTIKAESRWLYKLSLFFFIEKKMYLWETGGFWLLISFFSCC